MQKRRHCQLERLDDARAVALLRRIHQGDQQAFVVDDRALRAQLCGIPGIGNWAAEYVAMRALCDPDAFPAGDLRLRRKAGDLTRRELERRAEAWRPWRAYATMLLWQNGAMVSDGKSIAGRALP